MSIHALKKVLELVPEASGHIKRAHAEVEYPVDNKDSVISSALQIEYMMKVAHLPVDPDDVARVHKAVRLYGVGEDIVRMSNTMVKQAHDNAREAETTEQQLREAESILESRLQGLCDMEKIASAAEALYDEYSDMITSPVVMLYAGAGMLNKEAAVNALKGRATQTGNREFLKVAHVLSAAKPEEFSVEENRAVIHAITGLEKSAGMYGADIYREVFMVKEAQKDDAVKVSLGSKEVSVSQLKALGKEHVSDILGADIAKALEGPAMQVKQVVEALPIAEKQVLARLTK